jgi:hypothetical protein
MMDDVRDLKRLNFSDLLVLDYPDVASYSYADYRKNGFQHPKTSGYCIECERKGCSTSVQAPGFRLNNMSHGAHSTDFLAALQEPVDVTAWHDEPVLFVYESPSADYGIYETASYEGQTKRPAKRWYWVRADQPVRRFPEGFIGGTYGEFVLSAIITFRLKNAYMTNLVKCGMNSNDGQQFRGLAYFQPTCVQTCIDRYLRREIEFFKPRVIFTVGSGVYNWVVSTVGGSVPTHQLPHPAGRRRGFKDSYFRVLYFWLVLLALDRAGIIPKAETEVLARTFIRDYQEP